MSMKDELLKFDLLQETETKEQFIKEFSDKIIFCLVNGKAENKEDLVVCRKFFDMRVEYRLLPKVQEKFMPTLVINKAITDKYGITEKELYELAYENTKRLLIPEVLSMKQVLMNALSEFSEEDSKKVMAFIDGIEETDMYVISDRNRFYGATMILYPEILRELADKLKSNLILLPSSIHEWIALNGNNYSIAKNNPDSFRNMVRSVNNTALESSEKLSDQVYYYDRSTGEMSIL